VRIAITGAHQAIVGGAETYLKWLLGTLAARGHEVAFAFEHAASGSEQRVDGELDPRRSWDIGKLGRSELMGRLEAFRPDLVFLQSASDHTLDLEVSRRFRCVLFAHAFYGTCATGWKVHHLPTLQVCTRRFGPACLPLNYLRGCGARNPAQLLRIYENQRTRAKVVSGAVGVVVASDYMRQVYVQNGVDERRVRVIPYPTSLEPDVSAPSEEANGLPRRVLFLGRLTTGKGGVRAIQAVALCQRRLGDRQLVMTMAGDGPELERCRRLAAELGVRCELTGWVGAERRLQLLRAADVLVVPSLWPEPFGMVGLEAASLGVPSVAFRTGGIVDWLRPGASGELAEGFGAEALADALDRALRDGRHHQQLRLGAWQTSLHFRGNQHADLLEAFFRELTGSDTMKSPVEMPR
jgi:glycosyltransferase involved in cell wall biosynthesis